jgi:o-succinylbenzoate synthase
MSATPDLRVERIVMREIRLPLREPFRISSGVCTERRILLLELHQDERVGWSECVAGEEPNYSEETVDTAWLAISEWLAPRLFGGSLSGPAAIHPLLERGICGHRMAKAAVEMGGWALAAELKQVSLSSLLGGVREQVATGISIGIQTEPSALVDRVLAAGDAGYARIKVKIAPGADLEFLRAAREALGPEVPLMADANSAYTLSDTEHLARLDPIGLTMLEQPLGRDDLVRHAALQRRLRTPICLDESIVSPEAAEDMVALGSGRIVNIKPGRVGGFTVARRIHDVCAAAGVPVWCGGMLESGIGRAHNVALASLPNFSLPGDLSPSARYWARDVVHPEWTMDDSGAVEVPRSVPGIGVVPDRDRIEDLTVRVRELGRRPS